MFGDRQGSGARSANSEGMDPRDGRHAPGARRSLLARAGVIGAGIIDQDDPGHALIPTRPRAAGRPEIRRRSVVVPGDEAERWQQLGVDPRTALTLHRLGADASTAAAADVAPDALVGWLWHGFGTQEIAAWVDFGPVRTAARWRDAGFDPEAARRWRRVVDDPDEARRALDRRAGDDGTVPDHTGPDTGPDDHTAIGRMRSAPSHMLDARELDD